MNGRISDAGLIPQAEDVGRYLQAGYGVEDVARGFGIAFSRVAALALAAGFPAHARIARRYDERR